MKAPIIYEIRVRGTLRPEWSDWFDGMSVCTLPDGYTLISGPVADQSALHGLLNRIRDLNLVLVALRQVEADEA